MFVINPNNSVWLGFCPDFVRRTKSGQNPDNRILYAVQNLGIFVRILYGVQNPEIFVQILSGILPPYKSRTKSGQEFLRENPGYSAMTAHGW